MDIAAHQIPTYPQKAMQNGKTVHGPRYGIYSPSIRISFSLWSQPMSVSVKKGPCCASENRCRLFQIRGTVSQSMGRSGRGMWRTVWKPVVQEGRLGRGLHELPELPCKGRTDVWGAVIRSLMASVMTLSVGTQGQEPINTPGELLQTEMGDS